MSFNCKSKDGKSYSINWVKVKDAYVPSSVVCGQRLNINLQKKPILKPLNSEKPTTIRISLAPLLETLTIPNDLTIHIFEESTPGAVSVKYVEQNDYLVTINKFPINQKNPFSFIFQIRDPRVSSVNIRFTLTEQNNYVKTVDVDQNISFLYSDIFSQQSLDIINNWFISFFDWIDSGFTTETQYGVYILPSNELPQQFNLFKHAIYKIAEVNNLERYEINDYVKNNLQEFKSYCLDKNLFEDFYNKKKIFLQEENFSNTQYIKQQTTISNPIIEDSNFLGVSQNTWQCIMDHNLYDIAQQKPNFDLNIPILDWFDDIPVLENFQMSLNYFSINFNKIYNNKEAYHQSRERDFDCRSFSEATVIYLKNQLKNVCPNARVEKVGVPGHAMVYVDLGNEGDCCNGKFMFESTSNKPGQLYPVGPNNELSEEFCKEYEISPCTKLQEYDFASYYPNINNTKWEENEEQVDRITGIICDCLTNISPGIPFPNIIKNEVEMRLSSLCSHYSEENLEKTQMYDYFKNYYSYGQNNINSDNDQYTELPNTPQVIGCRCEADTDCGINMVCCDQDQYQKFCIPKEDCKPMCENDSDCLGNKHCCEGRCKETCDCTLCVYQTEDDCGNWMWNWEISLSQTECETFHNSTWYTGGSLRTIPSYTYDNSYNCDNPQEAGPFIVDPCSGEIVPPPPPPPPSGGGD